jgi:hypothetical protein
MKTLTKINRFLALGTVGHDGRMLHADTNALSNAGDPDDYELCK